MCRKLFTFSSNAYYRKTYNTQLPKSANEKCEIIKNMY